MRRVDDLGDLGIGHIRESLDRLAGVGVRCCIAHERFLGSRLRGDRLSAGRVPCRSFIASPPTDIGKPCLDTLDKSGAIAIDIGKIGRKIRSDWIAELAPSLEKRAVTPCAITTCAGCSAVAFNIAILIGIKASDSKYAESVSRRLNAFLDAHHSFHSCHARWA